MQIKLNKYIKQALFISLSLTLVACSTNQQKLLPEGSQTMAQIWANNTGGMVSQQQVNLSQSTLQARKQLMQHTLGKPTYDNSVLDYTRNAENEAMNLFPRLPNPNLVMFVFPHLTDSKEPLPVPGYSTVFPFYGHIHYAQPGESIGQL
ncbi:TIGR03751 family conjugal transfer lipoprotein [Actinobacillus delphinicola]|uniref:Conjugative transfer region lipoprotein n=1 Tax=Actinobacillus delphinicola TaxID=51161 RepID=A0A448TTR7_9PAST|nr:TIGR03751 family conjugal transfer lipoprotein [Actinobacillus delphinicola]VEJ09392.1 conjugative transfer region lipoprotein [Actinobacillus delphinicola]